ncbi:GAF domain-containing protein [Xylanimonas ulmi]|uniref:GAF domain-containing protein n=1 Tax=Xylanimonas ulmi TaxID=228973 RepID=A0A4Q7M614_9MICO|nr:GAF domain-containing protein [Xylanibacterium ulmi]RZS62493.1 GAF domain-containing protein [Xylanibacterium ulmi]
MVTLPHVQAPPTPAELSALLRASWARSRPLPRTRATPRRALSDDEAARRLRAGPLCPHLAVIETLLAPTVRDEGLVLVVADPRGRVLAVHGSSDARRRAGNAGVRAGYDWSERVVGTSGLGTAVAAGRPVRVCGAEHWARLDPPLTCWAVPVRGASGDLVGVLDLSGSPSAERGNELALLVAAAAAVEARVAIDRPEPTAATDDESPSQLDVIARRHAVLRTARGELSLSARHSEIALLLATRPEGLTADDLAHELERAGRDPAVVRAEMRRLRAALAPLAGRESVRPRPYRFRRRPTTDAARVVSLVRSGRLGEAVRAHAGGVLPWSTAPGVETVRREVALRLRTAVGEAGEPHLLLELARCPENRQDASLWGAVVAAFAPGSPPRQEALAAIERIDSELRD